MGGYGSGWHRRKKRQVEDCLKLSSKALTPYLQPGSSGVLTWGNGANISYRVAGDPPDSLVLSYLADGQPVTLRAGLILVTRPLLWRMTCPGCRRRCSVLYLPPGESRFACRLCHNLAYRSNQEQQKPGSFWDFTRLTFETESARRAIMQTPDLYDAGDLFDANSKSGDAHKARGWLEVAAEAFAQKHGSTVETNRIAHDAAARLAALLTTPELESAQAESEALADAALNALKATGEVGMFYDGAGLVPVCVRYLKATGEVGMFYDPGAGSPGNVLNEFGNLLKAVRVERISLGGGRWWTMRRWMGEAERAQRGCALYAR